MALDAAPEPYDELRHWKWIVQEISLPIGAIIFVMIMFSVMTSQAGPNGIAFLMVCIVVPLLALRAYGLWRVWRIRPMTADAETGVLVVGQAGFWWLLTSNSSPDSISLNDVEIETTQTPIEQVFFKRSCETLTIVNKRGGKGRSFHSVRDPYRIIAIHQYWNGKANSLNQQVLDEIKETNRLLRNNLPPRLPGQMEP